MQRFIQHSLAVTMLSLVACGLSGFAGQQDARPEITPVPKSANLELVGAKVSRREDIGSLVFEMKVKGRAGMTVPKAKGGMNGAPVLAHVFPTTLAPTDVGFGKVDGIVALAVTSHPDFDDTPLWDENGDRDLGNDGVVYHPHWVVLVPDERVPGGLSVREIAENEDATLPPTNPGMPMYMDSPGFNVVLDGDTLRVIVPTWRVSGNIDFKFDAVTAYMQVMPHDGLPLLGVYEVYQVLSGDLSLPYQVD